MVPILRFTAVLSFFLICVFVPQSSPAQATSDQLVFGAQFRLRYEFQDNFSQLYYGDDPVRGTAQDGFVLGRLRAGLDYQPTRDIHLALWMQSAEAWDMALADSAFFSGKFDQENNPNKDRWELWDAYLQIKQMFTFPLSLKAGRQRIFYGDRRVFGPGEWGNSGRWIWDAVKLSWAFDGGFLDAYYGKTLLHAPDQCSLNHRHGFESIGLYARFTLGERFSGMALEPFLMTKTDDHDHYQGEDQGLGDLATYYWGLSLRDKDLNGFFYDLTFIRQDGDFAQDNIRAHAYHLLLGYTFRDLPLTPEFSLEYSFASGDSNPNDGRRETFDGAFGARDMMYGRMNLFHWQNLKDAQVNFGITPCRRLSLQAAYHQFRLAEREDAWYLNAKIYRDKSGASGDAVGRELDLVATITCFKHHTLQVGYGHFRPDEFARALASDKTSNWFFVQWQSKFSWKIF